ncbi:MAG: polysaccharide pyruvyl transferase family protein [Magnetospiraceae bacterium]
MPDPQATPPTTQNGRPLRVGLLWHSLTSGNLGVRALTLSQLILLEDIAKETGISLDITIFGNRKHAYPESAFDSDVVTIAEKYVPIQIDPLIKKSLRLRQAYREMDLVIDIGEGDSFTDIYGKTRYWRQIQSRLMVLASGRPLILGPQTVGPFKPGRNEILPRLILQRAKGSFVRDDESFDYVRTMTKKAPVQTATDLAMLLPFDPPPDQTRARPRVGINVSGLLYSTKTDLRDFGIHLDYRAMIHDLIDAFAPLADVVIVNHVVAEPGHIDNDNDAAQALKTRYPDLEIAPDFMDPRDAKTYIATLDFFTGARMHACIGAFSSCTPLIPMAYSRKATGLFDSLGYDMVTDLTHETEGSAVVAAVLDGFHRRDQLKQRVTESYQRAAAKLAIYRNALQALITEHRP